MTEESRLLPPIDVLRDPCLTDGSRGRLPYEIVSFEELLPLVEDLREPGILGASIISISGSFRVCPGMVAVLDAAVDSKDVEGRW
jgi:hypothetical protein